jgi:myo-inositol 2-dehydrogenase / D-chiro-inositol 1-dehydrogenase
MLAVADVNTKYAEAFASRYDGRCKVYNDYRRMFDELGEDLDAVTIGTPDHWHTKITLDAIERGIDVYVEKPLTLTIAEGRQICEAVERTGAIVQVGTQQRLDHGYVFLKAAAMVRSGRLGKVHKVLSSVGQPDFVREGVHKGPFPTQPVPPELDWDMWLGQTPLVDYAPERCDYDFRWWFAYSGGQVTDWGIHHTDIAVWALGCDNTGPVAIDGTGTFSGVEGGFDVAETFDVSIRYAEGPVVQLLSGINELIFYGDDGRRIRVNRGGLTGKPVEELTPADEEDLQAVMRDIVGGELPAGHMTNFFDCVRTRQSPVANVHSHVNALNACHMANICLRLGRSLTWDQAAYRFVGDDEANAMIARDQRAPYQTTS